MAKDAAAAASEVHGRWCWSAPCLALFTRLHGTAKYVYGGKCLIVAGVTRAGTGGVCRTTTIYLEWRKKFLQWRGISSSDRPEDHQSASHGCTSKADSAVLGTPARDVKAHGAESGDDEWRKDLTRGRIAVAVARYEMPRRANRPPHRSQVQQRRDSPAPAPRIATQQQSIDS